MIAEMTRNRPQCIQLVNSFCLCSLCVFIGGCLICNSILDDIVGTFGLH